MSELQARQDAEHLKLLSIFHYVVAAMMALFGCFPIIHLAVGLAMVSGKLGHAKGDEPFPALVGWAFMLIASGFILTAWTMAACTAVLALAEKCGFLTGEGLELGREVLDVSGVGRQFEDLFDRGQEVVERSDWRQGRAGAEAATSGRQ
jgi:hypothetical protein